MIIDAMDLLYTENFTGFSLVSSDSDFTRLASTIREIGLTVYSFGGKKTPSPFVFASPMRYPNGSEQPPAHKMTLTYPSMALNS